MSVNPTYLRWNEWLKRKAANKLIEDFVKPQDRVQYFDVGTPMFEGLEKPPRDLFVEDGLHPTAKCYGMWASIIKPVLVRRFSSTKHAAKNVLPPFRFRFGVENTTSFLR